MRTAAAVFVASHGIGYSMWFMSAWTPSALHGSKNLTFASNAPATGKLGKAIGLLSLAVLAGFVGSAWGIWQETSWWPVSLIGSVVASTPVAFAIWNPVGVVRPARHPRERWPGGSHPHAMGRTVLPASLKGSALLGALYDRPS